MKPEDLLANKRPYAKGGVIEARICPECGTRNEQYKTYCYACGLDLKVRGSAQAATEQAQFWLFLMVVAFGFFVLANSRVGDWIKGTITAGMDFYSARAFWLYGGLVVFIIYVAVFLVITGRKGKKAKVKLEAAAEQSDPVPPEEIVFQTVTVSVPSSTKWQPETAQELIKQLTSNISYLVIKIQATYNQITWGLEVHQGWDQLVTNAIYSFYPQAQIEVEPKTSNHLGYRRYDLQAINPFTVPFAYVDDFKHIDTLAGLANAMANLLPGEEVIYELELSSPHRDYQKIAKDLFKPTVWQNFLAGAAEEARKDKHGRKREKSYEEKRLEREDRDFKDVAYEKVGIGASLRETVLALKVKAETVDRSDELAALAAVTTDQFKSELNFLVEAKANTYPLVLSSQELAAMWHLPSELCQAPGIVWAAGAAVALPTQLLQEPTESYILLGENRYRGQKQAVRLTYPDRVTHVNVIGRTRVGKSTFIHNLVHQDIANGQTVAVIDPHGDLVRDILACSIPPEREKDVVLFDVADKDYPIGLNLLTVPSGVPPDTVATQTLAVVRKLFAEQWSATRMEDVLYSALRSLVGYPGATIRDIPKLLSNPEYRYKVLQQVDDPETLDYWHDEYEVETPRQQREFARPINNRIRKFYRDPTIRRIICQQKSLNFRQMMDTNKIFLASLGGIGEIEAQTLGALLISKFQMGAMSRAGSADRTPVYLYIDEVQNFATTSLPIMFSEAGKYGLSLVTANQFLKQLEGATLDAILGNVGTSIMFATGPQDAKVLGSFVHPFTGQDLHGLDRFNTIVKMQVKGQTLPAFSMMTMPPAATVDESLNPTDRIKSHSRTTYGRPADEIDIELRRDEQPTIEPTPTKQIDQPEPTAPPPTSELPDSPPDSYAD